MEVEYLVGELKQDKKVRKIVIFTIKRKLK